MVDLKGVLILLNPLKDLSAEQLVTGKVQRILTRAVMLGNMGLTCLKVSARFVGKLHVQGVVAATLFSRCVAHSLNNLVMVGPLHTAQQVL